MSLFIMSMAIVFLFLPGLPVTSKAEPNYLYHICPNTTTFTPNSTYQSNLNLLLSSLASNSTRNDGFYNTTTGQTPDTVYGLFLCRGDLSTYVCQDCVTFATKEVVRMCPVEKVSVIWYDKCLLRYSNLSFFNSVNQDALILYNTQNGPNRTSYQDLVRATVNEVASRAASSAKKFATGEMNFPSSSDALYTLAQCTQDLSEENCQRCLKFAIAYLRNGSVGARTLTPSCTVRYETYPFYNLSAAPGPLSPPPSPLSPPPSPLSVPPTVSRKGNGGKRATRTVIIVVVTSAVVVGLLGLCYYVYCYRNKQSHEETQTMLTDHDNNSVEMRYFNLTTIREVTNNFSNANKLGEGGFGPVYKGELPDGEKVAVKRLSMKSSQGIVEFKNEMMLIVKLQHKNLVRLLGYCLAGDEKLLVYEYMANTSLDTFLFDPIKRKELDWAKRANIINGTAKGLQYLHEDSRLKIIHRDMKASNVLLDDELNPKISDFGTARIFGGNQLEANTERVVGTYGYMAPEYALEGLFSVKSDVYSFGVLMLEIITGQKSRGFYERDDALNLLSYASKLWTEGQGLKLIDPDIVDTCPTSEALRWIHIALLCVQNDPADRPTMSYVILMLGGHLLALPTPSPPSWHAGRFTTMSDQSSMSGAATGSLSSDLSLTAR
ncbi:cysteine-rich receptor-like protein kinase 10 [Tripterygium wilfordii]|uniref:cysteine-rich receptor-like protein kinase 10 n=1 Tax=Tripterygium wilfordii TaxID=458696 RepID=UPI0018F80AD8|nr:cysteine-rich receptor-like protein kinase 10 [Tripterygium wilfordii]